MFRLTSCLAVLVVLVGVLHVRAEAVLKEREATTLDLVEIQNVASDTVYPYTLTDLGTLGGAYSHAFGINAVGQVVGWASTADGEQHAFRTAPNSPINSQTDDIGTLGGERSWAYDVNDLGQVVGWANPVDSDARRAFRTAPNSPINPPTDNLGTLGGWDSWALAINNRGQVVGGSDTTEPSRYHAFRTAPNGLIDQAADLGTLGGSSSYAQGIDEQGRVVGAAVSSKWEGFRTEPDSPINPATDSLSQDASGHCVAYDINASGQVVGRIRFSSPNYHAFRTSPDSQINPATDDIGALVGAGENYAYAINAHGVVVGGTYRNGDFGAFVYDGSTETNLNDMIDPSAGWELTSAQDINDAGQIVGAGVYQGDRRAYLLTPVPEPSTLVLLAMGMVGLLVHSFRRRKA